MPLLPRCPAAVMALALGAGAAPARAVNWDPVSPADLGATAPLIVPDAAVEVLFRRITVDDSNFPEERRIQEYVRYKVLDPEKAVNLTRISQVSYTTDGADRSEDLQIAARLTNPDGSTRDFGRRDVQQKPLLRSASEQGWASKLFGSSGLQVNESFLAVTGLAKGAVLDIQTGRTDLAPSRYYMAGLQLRDVPERRLDVSYCESRDHLYEVREFALNSAAYHAASRHDDSAHALAITAQDLPPLYQETLSGPPADYALTLVVAYSPVNTAVQTNHAMTGRISVDTKANPWGGYATLMYILDQDRSVPTARVKALAAQLAAGAADDRAKAAAIHRYVRDLYQRFLHRPQTNRVYYTNDFPASLDDVLDFPDRPKFYFSSENFVFLEAALFRLQGWQAIPVALPDQGVLPFDRRLVSPIFLPTMAVRVRVGADWIYDCPSSLAPLALGELPWSAEQSYALSAARGTQEFLPVPGAPPGTSVTGNEGSFTLAADGSLAGRAIRRYTGHSAEVVRAQIGSRSHEQRQTYFHQLIAQELKPARIAVIRVSGDDDPDVPLQVEYSVHWPDYAVVTQDRLIFHPSAFRTGSKSPFPDGERHYGFRFPYAWTESDHVIWTLPAGYHFESPKVPPSEDQGVVSYKVSMALEKPSGRIHYRRDYSCSLTQAKADAVGPMKQWFDGVVARDQFELSLRRDAPAPKPDTDAAP